MQTKLLAVGIALLVSWHAAAHGVEALSNDGTLPDVFPASALATDGPAEYSDAGCVPSDESSIGCGDGGCADGCCTGGCCDNCCDDCCYEEQWQFSFGALYMARDYNNAPITIDAGSGTTVLSAADMDGDYGWGYELHARRPGWDVRYMQLNFGDTLNGNAVAPTLYLQDVYAGPAEFRYHSDLYSLEVTCLCFDDCDPWRRSSGFRYLRLDEQLDFNLVGAYQPTDRLETTNDLYGWQWGTERAIIDRCDSPFQLHAFGKAGVYYASMDLTNTAFPGLINDTARDSEGSVAFVGELGFNGSVQVTEQFSLDAGYQVMFIEGVALAGEQATTVNALAVPAVAEINCGGLFYQGFTFGATYTW
ncbi:MAG: BBP7 family outer membrane beta-barrel protein [Planctomycetota bacterium]|nr:BBP7 family outer membrane beta-barrel protein [Planctomycetota bacterium]